MTIMILESIDVLNFEDGSVFGSIGLRKDRFSFLHNHIDAGYVVLCYFRCGGIHLAVSEYQFYKSGVQELIPFVELLVVDKTRLVRVRTFDLDLCAEQLTRMPVRTGWS